MKKIFLFSCAGLLLACQGTKTNTAQLSNDFDKQGHRGSRGLMPENTIPAMKKAIDLGVTTVELDVVISQDKKVVVSHDVHFHQNITTTPDGKHLTRAQAEKHLLYSMPYDSIRKYDVGLKPHPDFPRQEKMAVAKPLLSELLIATEDYAREKNRTIRYNVEIKSKPENDGKKHPPIEEFIDLVIAVIKKGGVAERTIVQSFDPRGLQVIHRKYPGIPTALLIDGSDKRSIDEQLRHLGFTPDAYSPHYSLVNTELVENCHKKNIRIIPWTVNSVDAMKKLVDLKVDGIISDYPDLFEKIDAGL